MYFKGFLCRYGQKDPLLHEQGFLQARPKNKMHTEGLDVLLSNPHLSLPPDLAP